MTEFHQENLARIATALENINDALRQPRPEMIFFDKDGVPVPPVQEVKISSHDLCCAGKIADELHGRGKLSAATSLRNLVEIVNCTNNGKPM